MKKFNLHRSGSGKSRKIMEYNAEIISCNNAMQAHLCLSPRCVLMSDFLIEELSL